MTDKVNEKRKTKYYLVDGILYELAVNFELMTMNLYALSEDSTEETIITDHVVVSNNLTANNFVKYDDMTEMEKVRIVNCCMGLTRQMLSFKYDSNKRVIISHFDAYEKAYERWKEVLGRRSKQKGFGDVKECKLEKVILEDDTKESILSTINFVKKMDEYLEIGAEIPAGILLEGPPGTGKTLVAKTIANETNMNYKGIVASDFIQKYVGESAKRIEKEFDDLAKKGGGILFIDEIDAIGTNRVGDENKEYRAALNKLLDCMSTASEKNIIVICATNLKEQLDPALIREGRIDKIINIPLPDFDSRVELFRLYMKKLKHENDIDYLTLAKETEGKSGAFISACCNHSGIYAVDQGCKKVKHEHVKHVLYRMLNKKQVSTEPFDFL